MDRDQDGIAIAFGMGGGVAAGGVCLGGGLWALLDPPAPALWIRVREDPPDPPRIHGTDRVCCAIRALGGGADPRVPVAHRTDAGARSHDHLLALDGPKAD